MPDFATSHCDWTIFDISHRCLVIFSLIRMIDSEENIGCKQLLFSVYAQRRTTTYSVARYQIPSSNINTTYMATYMAHHQLQCEAAKLSWSVHTTVHHEPPQLQQVCLWAAAPHRKTSSRHCDDSTKTSTSILECRQILACLALAVTLLRRSIKASPRYPKQTKTL